MNFLVDFTLMLNCTHLRDSLIIAIHSLKVLQVILLIFLRSSFNSVHETLYFSPNYHLLH